MSDIIEQCQVFSSEEGIGSCILKIPSRVRIPDIPLDCQKVNQAVKCYQELFRKSKTGLRGDMVYVHRNDLTLVGKYLLWWDAQCYWEVILSGGVRGYSLYMHEISELDWYFKQNADPFDFQEQKAGFRDAHSEALLNEHRFLQMVAETMGYSFSLRELVVYNPHGDPSQGNWGGDWQILGKNPKLSKADGQMNLNSEKTARKFYERLGFQEVWRND